MHSMKHSSHSHLARICNTQAEAPQDWTLEAWEGVVCLHVNDIRPCTTLRYYYDFYVHRPRHRTAHPAFHMARDRTSGLSPSLFTFSLACL